MIPNIQEMRARIYTRQVREKLAKYPAVAVLGPRQCGKTTLASQFRGIYFDMESEGSEARLDAEWDTLVAGDKLLVIDEAQQAPKVFPRLRGAIDAQRKRNGRFLLLGSVAPALMKRVSESLAGRLGLVYMTPFVLPELKSGQMDELWLRGGYPDGGILNPSSEMIDRLHKTANMIEATRRVLVCRSAHAIENERLLVIHPVGWLKELLRS